MSPPTIHATESRLVGHILEIINSAILVADHSDRILFANSKALRMFKAEHRGLSGTPLADLFMPEDRNLLVQNILKITKTRGEFEGEAMLLRCDGTSFIGLLAASAWPGEEGVGAVMTVHDITRLKSLERLLRRSERMAFLGRMLDDISHQIRNPVLAIGGFARRLANMDVPRSDYLQVIMDEAAHLELLLTTLTEFISLPRPRPEPVTVERILEDTGAFLKGLAEVRGITWVCTCPDSLLDQVALVDIRTFSQALEAAVLNACEAYEGNETERIVELGLEAAEEPWACAVVVSDWGAGIRTQVLPHVFDPFYTTKTGHVGMGLTFVRRIQEEQDGDVAIESVLGRGTVLRLFLARDRRRSVRIKLVDGPVEPAGASS